MKSQSAEQSGAVAEAVEFQAAPIHEAEEQAMSTMQTR